MKFKRSTFPKISVIMNCHNGKKYLKKSIQSVIRQSYKNWEIIFYDNKSTDKSEQIAKNFRDRRIKIFSSNRYLKLYEARNYAIKKASGEYISFLDTDDWWVKDKLEKQVYLINKKKGIKVIYSNFYHYNQKTKKKVLHAKKIEAGKITNIMLRNYKIGILTVMISRSIFKKEKFDINYNIIGDFDFFIKLSLIYSFYTINEPLAYYRWHKSNYSKKSIKEYIREYDYWINKNKKLFKRKKLKFIFPWLTLKKLQIKSFLNLG